jgi:hypothetical protein
MARRRAHERIELNDAKRERRRDGRYEKAEEASRKSSAARSHPHDAGGRRHAYDEPAHDVASADEAIYARGHGAFRA